MTGQNFNTVETEIIFSYGGDGTTAQALYHQASSTGEKVDDHSLFTMTQTPLQLTIKQDGHTYYGKILPQLPIDLIDQFHWSLLKKVLSMYYKHFTMFKTKFLICNRLICR